MALDILIIVIAASACIVGFMKGIIGQGAQIGALIAGVVVSRLFGGLIAGWLASTQAGPTMFDSVCGYSIAFIVAYVAVWLAFRAFRSMIRALHIGIFDRLFGAVFTLLLWTMMLSIALNIYAAATNDVELIEGDPDRPWRTAVVRLAPVTLGYLASRADISLPVD